MLKPERELLKGWWQTRQHRLVRVPMLLSLMAIVCLDGISLVIQFEGEQMQRNGCEQAEVASRLKWAQSLQIGAFATIAGAYVGSMLLIYYSNDLRNEIRELKKRTYFNFLPTPGKPDDPIDVEIIR